MQAYATSERLSFGDQLHILDRTSVRARRPRPVSQTRL